MLEARGGGGEFPVMEGGEDGMSDTPKFEVIDRRKFKAEHEGDGEQQAATAPETAATPERVPSAGVGLGIRFHAVPFQCTIRVLGAARVPV